MTGTYCESAVKLSHCLIRQPPVFVTYGKQWAWLPCQNLRMCLRERPQCRSKPHYPTTSPRWSPDLLLHTGTHAQLAVCSLSDQFSVLNWMLKLGATLMRPYGVWTYCSVSISCARGTPLLELPRCFLSFGPLCALCAGGLDSHWTGPDPAAGQTDTLQKQGQRFRWSSNVFLCRQQLSLLFSKRLQADSHVNVNPSFTKWQETAIVMIQRMFRCVAVTEGFGVACSLNQ